MNIDEAMQRLGWLAQVGEDEDEMVEAITGEMERLNAMEQRVQAVIEDGSPAERMLGRLILEG